MLRGSRLILAVASCGVAWGAGDAFAQGYPAKAIRVIVPFAPGGATDITGRTVSARMAETLKQTIIVDNRSGGGGVIGADIAAKAPPDGYTVLLATPAETAILPHLQKMPYDPLKDLAPVSLATASPLILVVHPSLPAKSVKELIALVKARPGQLSYGSAGTGGVHHLAGELLKVTFKLDMVHVPYKGVGAVIPDLLGGHIPMTFSSLPPSMPYVAAGKLRALAVTSPKRSVAASDVPTMIEAGVSDFVATNWFAYFVPAGTPEAIVGRLNAEINRTLKLADVKEKLLVLGLEPLGTTPQELGRFVREESAKFAKLIKLSGVKMD
ncbi:MAG TPA: tripartite tricarboxylate transporter substrate binding protein [Burkholderiales bacterium]|nr:tripartite tricarboxylate transporter substrate binding protein [Burkholderiales bacterium]